MFCLYQVCRTCGFCLQNALHNSLSKNNKEIRTGASFSYKIIPSVKLAGEIYRQTTNVENYYGEHSRFFSL